VPRNLLCNSSKFFQTATKPQWEEFRGESRTIHVESEPAVFRAYVQWLHLGTIPYSSSVSDVRDYPFLAKLYVLGEELMDIKFKNDILDTIIVESTTGASFPIGQSTQIIYDGTPVGSPARRFLVDSCANHAHVHDTWNDGFNHCPKEFLVDVMKAMVRLRPAPALRPWLASCDYYHESE
jgi:hypothetical protein